jgi:hypothetical protein
MNYLNQSESAQRRVQRNQLMAEIFCAIYDNMKAKKVGNKRLVALSLTLTSGSPPYHVGFDRAYDMVKRILHSPDKVTFKNHINQEMWMEITKKVKCLMQNGHMSAAKAVPLVLENCRASRFFISKSHAWAIIKRELIRRNCARHYNIAA